jgi:hypothetical protein
VADSGGGLDPAEGAGRVWPGYGAFAVGLLYALVSAYWAAGGRAGVDTLGGSLAKLARERDPALIAIVWVTAALKLGGAVLGLAVTRQQTALPRLLVIVASWGASALLVLYGGILVVVQGLVQLGVLHASETVDWRAFHWHLYLWDPWFLLWGLLLGAATVSFTRRTRGLS